MFHKLAGIAAAGILAAAPASADAVVIAFDHTAQLNAAGGAEIADYTVSDLQPSGRSDGVWLSDVIVWAEKGPVTPIIGAFNALAANGASYPAMAGTQSDGLSNQPIDTGSQRTGRIYFQVGTGAPPDSVVDSQGRGRRQRHLARLTATGPTYGAGSPVSGLCTVGASSPDWVVAVACCLMSRYARGLFGA